jgi:Bacillus/Clostridium GerA spore germination protein.
MILAATFGFFGMFIGLVVILLHMTNLHSFGVPYLSPVAPLNLDSLKDTFVRAPWWAMIKRPGFITTRNANRINKH